MDGRFGTNFRVKRELPDYPFGPHPAVPVNPAFPFRADVRAMRPERPSQW